MYINNNNNYDIYSELETPFMWDLQSPFTIEPLEGVLEPHATVTCKVTFSPKVNFPSDEIQFFGNFLKKNDFFSRNSRVRSKMMARGDCDCVGLNNNNVYPRDEIFPDLSGIPDF